MKTYAKFLVGLCTVLVCSGVSAVIREQKTQAVVTSIRASLVVGDSKEKVEQVMLAHGLQPKVGDDGRSYVVHVGFLLRPDVSVIVALDGHWQVALVSVEERI